VASKSQPPSQPNHQCLSSDKCLEKRNSKYTLLCLANRRSLSGGRRVVTNEHLTRALHYFDVRMLVADVDFEEAEETSSPRSDFFQRYYVHSTSDDASDNQSGSSSSTSTKRQSDNRDAASSAQTTIAGAKRKASNDPSSPTSLLQSSRARKSS
jgi:Mg-chelatase subunit ChlI